MPIQSTTPPIPSIEDTSSINFLSLSPHDTIKATARNLATDHNAIVSRLSSGLSIQATSHNLATDRNAIQRVLEKHGFVHKPSGLEIQATSHNLATGLSSISGEIVQQENDEKPETQTQAPSRNRSSTWSSSTTTTDIAYFPWNP